MSAADYDRTPTSAAERVRWRVGDGVKSDPGRVTTDEGAQSAIVGDFVTPELAACACHDHNVMVAAREQRAMREDAG